MSRQRILLVDDHEVVSGSKIGIHATRKLKEEGHARPWSEEIKMLPEIKALMSRRWKEYGFE